MYCKVKSQRKYDNICKERKESEGATQKERKKWRWRLTKAEIHKLMSINTGDLIKLRNRYESFDESIMQRAYLPHTLIVCYHKQTGSIRPSWSP